MISENLQNINQKLKSYTKLLAVSKTKPNAMVREAYQLGQRDFGENKVQDLLDKATELQDLKDINWHFIGSLQTNKINKLLKVPNLKAIHSVDRLELLEKLLKKEINFEIKIFLQINTSHEAEKSGFTDMNHVEQAIELLKDQRYFKLNGLMTIGSIRAEDFEAAAKESFQKLSDLKRKLDEKYQLNLELSMGMSQDFEIAMEYGSNWIRIGSQIFGARS